MNQGNGFPPGVGPWLAYNQGCLGSTAGTMNPSALGITSMSSSSPSTAAGNFGGDASRRVPQKFQQHRGRPQQAACNQQSTGFNAATFASALGHGNPAQNIAPPKTSAFDLLGKGAQWLQALREIPTCCCPGFASGISWRILARRRTSRHRMVSWELSEVGLICSLFGNMNLNCLWSAVEWSYCRALWKAQPCRVADMHLLLSPQGYRAVLSAMYDKYFPYLEASAPKAIDKFLYEGESGKSESFTAYIASEQLARNEMESQLREVISDRLCGRILLKQTGTNEFQREMLMLRGPILRSFAEVANLLRTLDRPEMLVETRPGVQSRNYPTYQLEGAENQFSAEQQMDENVGDEEWDDEESSSQDADGHPYIYFEDRKFTENESTEILAYHSACRDVRKELQKRRNERGFVKKGNDSGGKGPGKRHSKTQKNYGRGKSKFSKGTWATFWTCTQPLQTSPVSPLDLLSDFALDFRANLETGQYKDSLPTTKLLGDQMGMAETSVWRKK